MKKKILVFPAGSEVALEIHRSLRYSMHFDLIGASSTNDHGKFTYEKHIENIPYYNHPDFIKAIENIIHNENIDAIIPAMDLVAHKLKENENKLDCIIIGSSPITTATCLSKSATYLCLNDTIPCPMWTKDLEMVKKYPVFIKPDKGYGSRNVKLAYTNENAKSFIGDHPNTSFIFCENLPGNEFTIDCFSNRNGELLFHGVRQRVRVSNGISVNTMESDKHKDLFSEIAVKINQKLKPRGAWFFQMKESKNGQPMLLEVATRLAGSSSYFRAKGINFALLSAFDAFKYNIEIDINHYNVNLDRALGNRYKIDISYEQIFVDFDDCLIIDNQVNDELVKYIFQALNKGIKISLITRHKGNLKKNLKKYKLYEIFDEIIHIKNNNPKSLYIKNKQSIFIDDSFHERLEVKKKHNIPVFSPDMVEMITI